MKSRSSLCFPPDYSSSEPEDSIPRKCKPAWFVRRQYISDIVDRLYLQMISGISHPKWKSELKSIDQDLVSSQYAEFSRFRVGTFEIEKNGRCWFLFWTFEKPILMYLLQFGLHRYLLIDDPRLMDNSIRVLMCLFRVRISFFDSNFAYTILTVINCSLGKALKFFLLYLN
jgi:hypothetical protein